MKSIDNISNRDMYATTEAGQPIQILSVQPKPAFKNYSLWKAAKEEAVSLMDLVDIRPADCGLVDCREPEHPEDAPGFETCFRVNVYEGKDTEEFISEMYQFPEVLKLAIDMMMDQPDIVLSVVMSDTQVRELPLGWRIVYAEGCQADIYMKICYIKDENASVYEERIGHRWVLAASVGWAVH